MRTVPFSIPMPMRFRGIERREGVLLEGSAGWAEFSPFLDYDTAECLPWLRAALDSASRPWPEPRREQVPVNCTVPAVDPDVARDIVERSGCRTAKVKVAEPGQDLTHDLARVAAVREAIGPDGHVRVDANGGWTLEEAERAVTALDAAVGLEYVEQPCAAVEDLAALRRRVAVKVAADESIRRADDPYRVRDLEAADIAVLKVQPLGGVHACLRIAEQIELPVVVSSAVETSIGLAAGLALAAALPDLPHACGLATTSLLDADVVARPLVPVGGLLPAGRLAIDPDALAGVAPPPATVERWHHRLAEVTAMLEQEETRDARR
ncbi:o-succinylbenzoate synthase [Aeromicrobium sp. CF4.19]|uniref:o-succinylbenzoate synthase n=1 Tax=Aeromicrobium sp. CF4.19 TaxID=3373082 RepID=UPI003EE5DD08